MVDGVIWDHHVPMVSIVIVNWNGIDDTKECLQSLLEIDYKNIKVIVIDNGSSNNEAEQLRNDVGDPRVQVVSLKRNLGFAIASNIGIRLSLQSGADYIMLLNNDTIVDRFFLSNLVSAIGKNPKIGIVAPKIYFYHDKKRIWYAGGKVNLYFKHKIIGIFQLDRGQFDNGGRTDYGLGACMLVRREVFEKVGLLAREYFYGPDDVDFCIRARRGDFLCWYVPESTIWHKESGTIKRHGLMNKKVFYIVRNAIILKYKFLGSYRFLTAMTIFLCLNIPVFIIYYTLQSRDPKVTFTVLKGIKSGFKDMKSRPIRLAF